MGNTISHSGFGQRHMPLIRRYYIVVSTFQTKALEPCC